MRVFHSPQTSAQLPVEKPSFRRMATRRVSVAVGLLAALVARSAFSQVWIEDERQTLRQRREAHAPRIENALLQAQGIQKSNPELALDILQSIFDAAEDSYFVSPAGSSLKDAAEAVLLADREGLLKAYARRFEAAASGLFEKARREGGSAALLEVVRRYGMTQAGRDAAFELLIAACDSGDAATALRLIQRLRRSEADAEPFEPRITLIELWARRELRMNAVLSEHAERLQKRFPQGLELEGRRVAWFESDDQMNAWLDRLLPRRGGAEPAKGLPDWRMAYGEQRRNGVSTDAPPFLDTAWKASLADRYDDNLRKYDDPWNDADIRLVNTAASDVESRFRKDGLNPLPVATPLVVNDLAIFAGFGTVKAYRLKTGELAWSTEPVDETLSALLAGTDVNTQTTKPNLLRQFVGQRAYRDHVDAALSTDGQRVYHIGHSGLVGLQPFPGNLPSSNRGISPLLPRNYNQLQAYEINGGRCLWSVGGPPRRQATPFERPDEELDLDGAFFCMAPIAWQGQLLCIIEQSRQLRVVALDPEKNPEKEPTLWSQALLNSDVDLVYNADRRFAGVHAALDGSTLVASLGNGTVVGFDVANRRWMWLNTYAEPQPVDYRRQLQMTRMSRPVTENADLEGTLDVKEWSDSRVLITGGRVLVTPFDDSRIHCLDCATGKTLWTRPRDQAMYMAGESDGVVLLVGKSDVRGLNLDDGMLRWTTPIPPSSGRGVRMGSRYVLPLSTGEVLTLDVASGAPFARSPLVSGQPAGNLAAAEGMLVTQTGSEFRAFRSAADLQKEIDERLKSSPGDKDAIALSGELKLHRGEVQKGEEELKSVAEPPERLQRVLAWAKVNGLERDFDRYFTPDLNLDELPKDSALRVQAWSAVARGLERRGDLPGALLAALRAGEAINAQADRLLDREQSLRVRENRLVRGRIDDLWEAMSREQKQVSLERIRERLGQLSPRDPELFRIQELLQSGILPTELELDQLERLTTMHPIVVEQRLLRLRESSDPVAAARANLQLLRSAVRDPRMTPAPAVVAELAGRLKDVTLPAGQLAGEVANELLSQPDFVKRRDAAPVLSGELVATNLDDPSGIPELQAGVTEFGPRSAILQGWAFVSDASQSSLVAVDPRGSVVMTERINRAMAGVTGARISTSGRLVLAETADGFRIFDTVARTSIINATLLTEAIDPFMGGNFRLGRPAINIRGTNPRQVATLRSEHIAYVKGTQLVVADPLTGREYWSRVAAGVTDIFTDAEFVCVMTGPTKVKVYRAVDGRFVRESELPMSTSLVDYRFDSQRLLYEEADKQVTVGLFHPAREDWTWRKSFPAASLLSVVDARDLAVLERNGKLSLISGVDGSEMMSSQLDLPADVVKLEILHDASRLFVKAVRSSIGAEIVMTIPRGGFQQQVKAQLSAVDRVTGQRLWSRDFERLLVDSMQPGQWPFLLAVAAGETDQAADEQKNQLTSWAYLLDRATGKTLHAAELNVGSSSQRGWKIDPATGAVSIRVSGVGLQVSPRTVVKEPKPVPTDDKKAKDEAAPPPPPDSKPGT
ncbi:MAG TPA: PQQ-binding-like beta-propeller repeat protein [Caulifigura sp.]|nr:PQQ-binding-like beta-propeller repeat protein [Caulifigura sp.]